MACSSPDRDPVAGFATAAAMTWCMALSLVAAVALSAATDDLRTARRGLAQTRVEAQLEIAQLLAAVAVMNDPGPGRLAWVLPVDGLNVSVLAEPEAEKRGWAAASGDAEALAQLDPAAPDKASQALAALAATPEAAAGQVAALDPSPRWRACAASVLSPHGQGDGSLTPARAPNASRIVGRLGQVWRIRTSRADGWTETRYLRFTGEAGHPWAILERTLALTPEGNLPCL